MPEITENAAVPDVEAVLEKAAVPEVLAVPDEVENDAVPDVAEKNAVPEVLAVLTIAQVRFPFGPIAFAQTPAPHAVGVVTNAVAVPAIPAIVAKLAVPEVLAVPEELAVPDDVANAAVPDVAEKKAVPALDAVVEKDAVLEVAAKNAVPDVDAVLTIAHVRFPLGPIAFAHTPAAHAVGVAVKAVAAEAVPAIAAKDAVPDVAEKKAVPAVLAVLASVLKAAVPEVAEKKAVPAVDAVVEKEAVPEVAAKDAVPAVDAVVEKEAVPATEAVPVKEPTNDAVTTEVHCGVRPAPTCKTWFNDPIGTSAAKSVVQTLERQSLTLLESLESLRISPVLQVVGITLGCKRRIFPVRACD